MDICNVSGSKPLISVADELRGSNLADSGKVPRTIRNPPDAAKLSYIDGMRGLAILMVIVVHAEQNSRMPNSCCGHNMLPFIASFGQFGVQLFFVVSAYTLCLSHGRRLKAETSPYFNYALRRYFRIAPLYYVGIAVYFMLAILRTIVNLGNPNAINRYDVWNIVANVFLVHGFVPEANNSIVPGGWSIGTEMAFYAIFPILYAFCARMEAARKRLLWVLPLVALFSGIALNYLQHAVCGMWIEENSFTYNSIINQLPVFVSGMSLYFLTCHQERGGSFSSKQCALVAAFLGAITIIVWSGDVFALRATLAPCLAALTFAWFIHATKHTRFANNAILARIGMISYSIYVIHFAVVWGMGILLQKILGKTLCPLASLALLLTLSVPLIIALAAFSERFIERPGIALGRRVIRHMEQNAGRRE